MATQRNSILKKEKKGTKDKEKKSKDENICICDDR